jgi:hypothetical protein
MNHRPLQSPSLGPCAPFEPLLHCAHDRELTAAERARLDAHLDTCADCRDQLLALEALSATLKGWDARQATTVPVPGARLQRAVLAEVADQGRFRQAVQRRQRYMRYAAAAAVLVAIGLGVVLGRAQSAVTSTGVAATDIASALKTWEPRADAGTRDAIILAPQVTAQDLPTMQVQRDPTALFRDVPSEVRVHEPLRFRPMEQLFLAELEVASRERALHQQLGEGGVWVRPGASGEARLLSRSAYLAVQRLTGFRELLGLPPSGAHASITLTTPERPAEASTGRSLADVLQGVAPLQFVAGAPDRAILSWPQTHSANNPRAEGETRLDVRGLYRVSPALQSGNGIRARTRFADPLQAEATGQLRFEEGVENDADVIAFLKHSAYPVFLPAGQILTGGGTSRVVAEATWLPAAPRGERRSVVPCRWIGTGRGDPAAGTPHLSEAILGPTLRGLLAANVPAVIWRRAVMRQWQALLGELDGPDPLAWDLGDVFDSTWMRTALAALRSSDPRSAWNMPELVGFRVLDEAGKVRGIEFVGAAGASARLLLTRLYVGYQFEAQLRDRGLPFPVAELDTAALGKELIEGTHTLLAPGGAKGVPGEPLRLSHLQTRGDAGAFDFRAVELVSAEVAGTRRQIAPLMLTGAPVSR